MTRGLSLSHTHTDLRTGPVDDDVGVVLVEQGRAADGSRGVELAELEQPVKHRAVLPHVEPRSQAEEKAESVVVVLGE